MNGAEALRLKGGEQPTAGRGEGLREGQGLLALKHCGEAEAKLEAGAKSLLCTDGEGAHSPWPGDLSSDCYEKFCGLGHLEKASPREPTAPEGLPCPSASETAAARAGVALPAASPIPAVAVQLLAEVPQSSVHLFTHEQPKLLWHHEPCPQPLPFARSQPEPAPGAAEQLRCRKELCSLGGFGWAWKLPAA